MKSRLFFITCVLSLLSFLVPATFAQTPDPYPETIICDQSPCEVINADRLAGIREDVTLEHNTLLISPNNTPNIINIGYTWPDGAQESIRDNGFLTPRTVVIPKENDLIIPLMGIVWNNQGLSYSPFAGLTGYWSPHVVPGNTKTTITPDNLDQTQYIESNAIVDNTLLIWLMFVKNTPEEIKLHIHMLTWYILQPSTLPPMPYGVEISPYPSDWAIGEIVTLNRIYPEMEYYHVDGSDWKIVYIATKAIEIIRKGNPITIRRGQFFFAKPCPGYEYCYYFEPDRTLLGTDFEIIGFGPEEGIKLKSLTPPNWVDDASKG